MTEKAYYLNLEDTATKEAVDEIIFGIPCWVSYESVEMGYTKVSFQCRMEDVRYIEEVLAPFV